MQNECINNSDFAEYIIDAGLTILSLPMIKRFVVILGNDTIALYYAKPYEVCACLFSTLVILFILLPVLKSSYGICIYSGIQ